MPRNSTALCAGVKISCKVPNCGSDPNASGVAGRRTAGSGTLLFKAGETKKTFKIYVRGDKTYEEHVGKKALARVGKKRWRKRVRDVAEHLAPVFNYATLYVGGGNARLLHAEDLPRNVKIVSNEAGLLGGLALWR